MLKAYEVMTRPVATCGPEASVAEAAAIMRDRDIGSVLIVEEGKLRGIVTDRDLALQALTGTEDPRQISLRKFVNGKVITGEATWSLEQVAKIMAEHQIRRVPIVQAGQLVGMVSLGDVSRHEDRKDVITESLQAVSTPSSVVVARRSGRGGALLGLALAAVAATLMIWLTRHPSGQTLRKQVARSELYHAMGRGISAARDKVGEAASSKSMRDLRRQMLSSFDEIVEQLPTLGQKPPKRKFLGIR
ncbi:Hypoxic response protein 1 [Thermoflexales bacterium]|nr:Hypoxic response protein 1 [Thermoflexales bacterium]